MKEEIYIRLGKLPRGRPGSRSMAAERAGPTIDWIMGFGAGRGRNRTVGHSSRGLEEFPVTDTVARQVGELGPFGRF